MQRFPKVFTLMSAILALAFCLASCKTNVDDYPTMYTVTVSSSIEHGKVSVDKTSAEAGATVKLTATADSGYELVSYSVKDADGKTVTVTDGKFTMPESDVTVTATFAAVTYTVTFNSNGGSDVKSQTVASGSKATEPADPTKTATKTTKYTFDAWYSDSGLTTPFSFDTAIKKDITLYAKWTETAVIQAGSISYDTTSVEKTAADQAFTNTLTKTGDGTVTYASSKTDVAEVNATTGLVTIKGAGETTITATVADSDNYTYATKTASYTLTVTQASPYNLKTGFDIYSILVQLCPGSEDGYSACTKFARSETNNEEATLYLDTEEKYIPVWSKGTEVYYYVPDGRTPVMNEDSSGMFLFCTELTSLDVTGFDTSNVTNMAGMFYGCSKLTSLDVSKFVTSKVENMSGMFMGCSGLTSLDLSKFVTSKVTDMSSMFMFCSGLTNLNVTVFNTSNVTNMSGMFYGCSKLTSLDLSKFATGNVTDMSDMFSCCSGLTNLDVTGFNTSNVTDMGYMFSDCSKLISLDLSKFVTSNVQDMEEMFSGCEGLTSLDVSTFGTSNVKGMKNMFSGCSKLTSLDVSKFDTGNVTDMYGMFDGCSGLKSLDVTGFNTSKVTMMTVMFNGCKGLTSLDLSKFDTSSVTDMKNMFSGCKELTTIYATDKFVTTSVTNGDNCFEQCSNLVGGSGTIYDENNIDVTYARIDGGNSAPGYFTLKLIGSKSKPDAVGDIVFSDGSATAYTSELTLTEEQKSKAVAVIFYAGSASDTLGAKTLGVGLKNTEYSPLAWAKDGVNGHDTIITAIQCTPSPDEEGAAATATFTGDTDGSDNWQDLCDAVSDEEISGNYPAWEWVNAYATTANLTDDYASGWYLPTVAELSMLYRAKDTVNSALEKAGGTAIADAGYWSSSQDASDEVCAWIVCYDGLLTNEFKSHDVGSVCTVRAF